MLRSALSRACSAVAASAVVALSACDNQSNPNTTSPEVRPTHDLTAPGTSPLDSLRFGYIYFDSLATNTFVIGGPEAYYTAEIVQRTSGAYTMQVYMVQPQTRQLVDVKGPLCRGDTGCRIDWEIVAPAGSGLVPGAATVEWQLFLNGLLIDTRDLGMTLVAGQSVSAVTLSANTIALGGPSAPYSVTLQNVAPSVPELSGVAVQGWLVQPGNNARRAAGGAAAVQCGSYVGTLPHGPCTFSTTLAASNNGAGTGTLSPGSATFEVDLLENGMVVSQKTVPVVLQSSATISGLTLSATTSNIVPLEGASVAYAATIQNVDASLSGVSLQGFIRQGGARRFAGGTSVSCGGGAAVLPTGTCTLSSQLTATNNSGGKGTLVSGDATFELQLMDGNGAVLSIATIPVSIVEGPLGSGTPSAGASADRLVGARILKP